MACRRRYCMDIAVVIFLVTLVHSTGSTMQDLTTANSEFALDLYQSLKSEANGSNIFVSPFSIATAMAMTFAGSKGKTRSQIAEVLKLQPIQDKVPQSFHDILKIINSPTNNYTLKVANRMFGRKGYKFMDDFLRKTEKYFGASLEALDLTTQPEKSRVYINKWVANSTMDKIKELIPKGFIDAATVLVLANAIYFKGLWMHPFKSASTEKGLFYLSNTSHVKMDMMHTKSRFKYAAVTDMGFSILELPYEGMQVSLFIVLPDDTEGLGAVESTVTPGKLREAISNRMTSTEVTVAIPRFKLTQEINLKVILSKMGIEDLFNAKKANLSGIDGQGKLYMSEVVHKAYIDVNEEGTEAAGATGGMISVTSIQQPVFFRANRPFMFFIREKTTGIILFVGRFVGPPKEKESIGYSGRETNLTGEAPVNMLFMWGYLLVLVLAAMSL